MVTASVYEPGSHPGIELAGTFFQLWDAFVLSSHDGTLSHFDRDGSIAPILRLWAASKGLTVITRHHTYSTSIEVEFQRGADRGCIVVHRNNQANG